MTLLLYKKIELVGGPLDGTTFYLEDTDSSAEIILKDGLGIKRRYISTTERTKKGRIKFVYDGLWNWLSMPA